MFKQTSASYSQGFLMRLDNLISTQGWKHGSPTIKKINQDFKKIAEILMQKKPMNEVVYEAAQMLNPKKAD